MRRNQRRSRNNRIINKDNFLIIVVVITLIILTCISIILVKRNQDKAKVARQREILEKQIEAIYEAKLPEDEKEKEEIVKQDTIIDISVVGDILCNNSMTNDAKRQDKYDYSHMFSGIKDIIRKSDITIGTMETNFVEGKKYSDYGLCNSPKEFAKDVKDSGIDLISLAHNHILDYGKEGLDQTKEYLEKLQYETIGTKDENNKSYIIKDIKDIKVAFLSYTYGLSRQNKISTEQLQYVNIYNENIAKQELNEVKEQSDLIIVIMHWGEINKSTVSKEQENIAKFLVENGANIIVGSHPAVIQPMEVVQNSKGEDVFIAYSVGNYISNLGYEYSDLEMILNIQIRKDTETGKTKLNKVTYTPVYMLDNGYNKENRYRLVDIKEIAERYSNGDKEILTKKQYDLLIDGLEKLEKVIRNK